MKTKFEEAYALVMHSRKYKHVALYFEDTDRLWPVDKENIVDKYDGILLIRKLGYDDTLHKIEVPIHRIRAIVADKKLIFDRRDSYKGEKDMRIRGIDY